jgi:succinyl-diaminopimelate desuccinylase
MKRKGGTEKLNELPIDTILKKVKDLRHEIIDLERELIRIPSLNPPGEYQQISKCVADKIKGMGFEVSIVGPRHEKPNVIGRLKGIVGKPVLINNAHLDTVPPGSGWTVDPYEAVVKEGKIFGRGAYDAKARIVVYIMAARAIQEAGYRLRGDLIHNFTVDEETGGKEGAGYCSGKGYLKGDVAILEGRHDEIWYAESGHITLRIILLGVSAHAMYPWLGINAIEKMTHVLNELQNLQEELKEKKSMIPGLNYSTINVGTIKGGDKSNMLADKCSIDVDIRVIPESDVDEVISRIRGIIEILRQNDPKFKAKMEIVMKVEPSLTSPEIPVIGIIQKVTRHILGFEPRAVGLHAASDGEYYRKVGIPTIHWGVGTDKNKAHASDEFIEIDDLVNLTAAHALVNMEFLGFEKKK